MQRPLLVPCLLGLAGLSFLMGCSGGAASPDGSGGASGGSGGGGSGGNAASLLPYKPCDVDKRVGAFAMALAPATKTAPAFSTFQGGMNNAPTPSNNWPETAKDGDCHLVVGPRLVCTTPCSNDQVCAGQNQCLPQPVPQDLGIITLNGFSMPLTAKFVGQYYVPLPMPFPPFPVDAPLSMTTAGGAYPSFSLNGRGIEPMEFAGNNLMARRDQPMVVSWTAPKKITSTRVFVRVDIAHHGGVAARIECDVADNGSMTIAGSLISKLIDQGTAGFPTVSLTRRTMDSTTVTPGCVELSVASPVEQPISVDGVISCNQEDLPCPTGKTCGVDQKCS
jgi:hypothetical protein